MTLRAVTCLMALAGWPAVAASQARTVAPRWAVQLVGPAVVTHADLRFESSGARLLLESADSAWFPLLDLDTAGTRLAFRAGPYRFVGARTSDGAEGIVTDSDGRARAWRGQPVRAGLVSWPVRPRIAVRQLVLGSSANSGAFPADWLAAMPSEATLLAEHSAAAAELGWSAATPAQIAARADQLSLGFDPRIRLAASALLARIGASPAADHGFRRLFAGPGGTVRLDLHDIAWEHARRRVPRLARDPAPVVTALTGLGLLPPGGGDPSPTMLFRAGWQAWTQSERDSVGMARRLASLSSPEARSALQALLHGYDEARAWWLDAVRWLVAAPWIETPAGWRSPMALLAEFWGGDIGPLPALVPTAFGMSQAVPVLGAARLAPRLLVPRNAVAAEWLATRTAAVEALTAWRAFDVVEPLELALGGGERAVVTAPAALARTRYGSFLAASDAIQIEPGIMPLAAVTTVVHEWLHLLIERARVEGDAPAGLRDTDWGLRLLEADPWLGEGAAEWGTDMALAPARAMTPLFALLEAEKRLSVRQRAPDDPHVLGHGLVRALAGRLDGHAAVRELLIRAMHDPAAIARAAGFAGPSGTRFPRPATLAIIPEYVFTPDAGVADAPVRRLHLPVRPEALP